ARRHVARLAGLAVVKGHHEQVLPLVLDPLVPVAEEEFGEDTGLDRAFLGLLLPLAVERVALRKRLARILRVDRGDEGDGPAVGADLRLRHAAEAEQVIDLHGPAFAGEGGGDQRGEPADEQQHGGTLHGGSFHYLTFSGSAESYQDRVRIARRQEQT